MKNQLITGINHLFAQNSYSELNQFRLQVEAEQAGPQHLPHQYHSNRIFIYRLIFAGLSLLFAFFGIAIYTKGITWIHPYLFEDGYMVKNMLTTLCGGLSAFSAYSAYHISAEYEAIINLRKRARHLLRGLYRKKINELGIKRILPQGETYDEVSTYRQEFHDAWQAVNHSYSVSKQLLDTIHANPTLNRTTKARLYNQAILELNDTLTEILDRYLS